MNMNDWGTMVPELRGERYQSAPLRGGVTNRSFLLTGDFGKWVLRVNVGTRGVDRRDRRCGHHDVAEPVGQAHEDALLPLGQHRHDEVRCVDGRSDAHLRTSSFGQAITSRFTSSSVRMRCITYSTRLQSSPKRAQGVFAGGMDASKTGRRSS